MKASKWLAGILVLAGAAGAAWYFFFNSSQKVEYTTATLQRGDIESVVSATGSCNAVVSVQVGSQVSGNILELRADFNTRVTKGQVVAIIDPSPFQARVDQARASVDNARASVLNSQSQLKKAEADIASANANVANQRANLVRANSVVLDTKTKLARRQELFDQKVTSREDRDTAQANYDQATANVEAANAQLTASLSSLDAVKAQQDVVRSQMTAAQSQVKTQEANLEQAQFDLDRTQIRAPVDGTVIARNMDVGQTVAASFSAPTIFQIAQDLTKMQVDTNIDESDISRVQVGQQATFSVDAYPGQTFRGEVVQIRRAPINVQNVITYVVVIGVDNPDQKLFPGMTANVRLLVERARNALKLPTSSMRVRLEGVEVADRGRDYFKLKEDEIKPENSAPVGKGSPANANQRQKTGAPQGDAKGGFEGRRRGGFGGGDGTGAPGEFAGKGRGRFGAGEGGVTADTAKDDSKSGRGSGQFAGRGGAGGFGGFGGGRGGGRAGRAGAGAAQIQLATVYLMGADGKPRGERVRLGIGDGSFVAVLSPNLKEGDQIITGVLGQQTTAAPGFPGAGRGNNKGGFRGGGFF